MSSFFSYIYKSFLDVVRIINYVTSFNHILYTIFNDEYVLYGMLLELFSMFYMVVSGFLKYVLYGILLELLNTHYVVVSDFIVALLMNRKHD